MQQPVTITLPTNKTEARAIASQGGTAIPSLSKGNQQYNVKITSACITALALIGGDQALQALASYATDDRRQIQTALWGAWKYFDKQVYAQQVLSSFVYKGEFHLLKHATLDDLDYFPQLTGLKIYFRSDIDDLRPLTRLKYLQSLVLVGPPIHDLQPLSALTNLTRLHIARCPSIKDLTPLAHLSQLNSLTFYYCTGISDVSPLAGLSNLRELYLNGCNRIQDLHPLIELKQLERFSAWNIKPQNMPPFLKKLLPY